ncbi:MAG: hypothetical protein HFF01_00445 [Erysipelotrichaceae bacterium]|nr:hypothetical protein [Erysipelotrichaceae bacterium]
MSLVIDDAHIDIVKEYVKSQFENLDSIVLRYVKAMNSVIDTGIMEGATAEALKEFLNQVELKAGSNSADLGLIASHVDRCCINFVVEVDKADKELY